MERKAMRTSVAWGLRVAASLAALTLVLSVIQFITSGFEAIELLIVTLTFLPLVITLSLFTIIGFELVRAFSLLVRVLERKLEDTQ